MNRLNAARFRNADIAAEMVETDPEGMTYFLNRAIDYVRITRAIRCGKCRRTCRPRWCE